MAFIKAQKIRKDESGKIISGSAAIVDTVYGHYGSYHSKQTVREKLGKVLFLSDDGKSGVFLSPTRGLVSYDAATDSFDEVSKEDPRIFDAGLFPETEIHTVFGDTYLLLEFLKSSDMLGVLRSVFSKDTDYERVLCHVLHNILKDGARIGCDDFISKSFASYVFPDIVLSTLHTDSAFFSLLGDDKKKVAFFKAFVAMMQKESPDFGKGCYVDSTPLPNDINDNPFNALCCHGVGSSEIMSRLALVLDEKTGFPVWFDFIPGNILDLSEIMNIIEDVADTLGIEIDSLVLDAGYVSTELLKAFNDDSEKTIIGRMPNRRGYPYKTLYWEFKNEISKGKYEFVRKGHAYFGKQKEVDLFGVREYAYVYVDHYNALKRFSDYLSEHQEEYDQLKNRDKDWYTVKYGYFILLSNIDTTPADLLSQYFCRTEIEMVFKTSKEYLNLMPISKWTDLTVRGKILADIIDTIVLLLLRKKLKDTSFSTTAVFGKTQSLMCFRNASWTVIVETPNKQVKQYYSMLGIKVPSHVKLTTFIDGVMHPQM